MGQKTSSNQKILFLGRFDDFSKRKFQLTTLLNKRNTHKSRFHGLVGYDIRFTRERSRVRSSMESLIYLLFFFEFLSIIQLNYLFMAKNLVGSLLDKTLVTLSGAVTNGIVKVVGHLVLHQLVRGLLRVRLNLGLDFLVDIFAVGVGHLELEFVFSWLVTLKTTDFAALLYSPKVNNWSQQPRAKLLNCYHACDEIKTLTFSFRLLSWLPLTDRRDLCNNCRFSPIYC